MSKVTCTICKNDVYPEYHCPNCDGEYINKQELINEIKEGYKKLYNYMNPKDEMDQHDYSMTNDLYDQAHLTGKLKSYSELIKLIESK